ncbi:hypothetical protein FRC02_010283 [Tulasnella sp. 418]|nr:hypothetical protein FRC02_010283 [Tulasnella sp. 418]
MNNNSSSDQNLSEHHNALLALVDILKDMVKHQAKTENTSRQGRDGIGNALSVEWKFIRD